MFNYGNPDQLRRPPVVDSVPGQTQGMAGAMGNGQGIRPGVAAILQAMQAQRPNGMAGAMNGRMPMNPAPQVMPGQPQPVAPMNVQGQTNDLGRLLGGASTQAPVRDMGAVQQFSQPVQSTEAAQRMSRLQGLSPDMQRRLAVFANSR